MKISFKDLPVLIKQLVAVSILIVIAVFTLFHVQSFDSRIRVYGGKAVVTNKLQFYSQQIVLHSEMVLREKVKSKADLEKDINLFEKYFYTLKNGGELVGNSAYAVILPPSDTEKEYLLEIENIWFSYKESAKMILEEETFKGGIEMASGYKDDQGNYVQEEVFKSILPEIREALENVESESQKLAKKIIELNDYLTSKVSDTVAEKKVIGKTYFFLTLLSWVLYLLFFHVFISKRLTIFKNAFSKVVKGHSDITIDNDGNDEVGEMRLFLRQMISRLDKVVLFVDKVAKGDLGASFNSENENDKLANSLNILKNTLSQAKEEELKRKEEDDVRNWTTQGIAKFGEILRMNTDDLKELSYNIVSNLIDYVGAIQGGIFMIEQKGDDKILNLLVSYAFDREKYMKKELAWGESLVGRCALEQKTIYLKEVPANYLEITSGLGNSKPASVLLTPLTFNNEIFGVLEIASFDEIEDYKIEFIEKIGTSIGSTIANVRTNLQTSKLLSESKEQAERLAQQEEEMRQNMEEMQATQEEAHQKTAWLENVIKAVQSFGMYYELDSQLKIEYANGLFIDVCGNDYPIGNDHWDYMHLSFKDKKEYKEFMAEVLAGTVLGREVVYTAHGNKVWYYEQYSPVLNVHDEVEKIIVVGSDISEMKNKSREMEELVETLADRDNVLNEKVDSLEKLQEELSKKELLQKQEIERLVDDNNMKVALLAQKEKQSRLILDASLDCIFVFNSTWSINFANTKALSVLGLELKSIVGRDFVNFFANYFGQKDIKADGVISLLLDKNSEMDMKLKNGDVIPTLVSMSKSEGADGAIYTVFVKDLSELKKGEREREALFAEMIERERDYQSTIERLKLELKGNHIDLGSSEDGLVIWSKIYEIGNAEIDKQHKDVIDKINSLYRLYREGQNPASLVEGVNDIIEHVKEHVIYEENLFSKTDYPLTKEHKDKHHAFADQMKMLLNEFNSGDSKISSEILHFVRRWVDEHIKELDQELRNYISDDLLSDKPIEEKKDISKEKVEDDDSQSEAGLSVVEWKDEFENSNKEFNDHHKTLFDLMNQLVRAYLDKKNKRQLKNIAKGLSDYAEYHFSAEERAFSETDYPDKDKHHKEHSAISAVLSKIMSQINSKHQLESSALEVFVDMFCEHLKTVDAGYQDFL